jgi:hypothetical protein
MPGDYIVRAGEIGDRMFFIKSGECQVCGATAVLRVQQ